MAGDPLQPGLWGRWLASDLTGAADGTVKVPSWTGTNSVALANATAGEQPVLNTDAGARRFVQFDGTDDRLFVDPASLMQAKGGGTVYVVANIPAAVTTIQNQVWISTAGGTGGTSRLLSRAENGAAIAGGRRLDADAYAQAVSGTALVTGAIAVRTHLAEWSAAVLTIFENGESKGVLNPFQTAGNTENTSPLYFAFGAATGSGWARMDLYEVLIYEAAHTAAERAQVHTYIQDTYGVTVVDYVAAVTLTQVRPASDVAAGGWGAAPLWSKVNDVSDTTSMSGTAA